MTSHPMTFRFCVLVMVLAACIGCDQFTKFLATEHLRGEPGYSYLADTVRLQYALNPGGFLSFGSSLPTEARRALFLGVNGVALATLLAFLMVRINLSMLNFVAGALVLAGGLGNLIDRWSNQGFVVDFLNIGLGAIRSGIFNVADVAISAGLVVWLWTAWQHDTQARLAIQEPTPEVSFGSGELSRAA